MRQLVLVVHLSLDGFVAGINGELDGLDAGEENLAFVNRLTAEADAALFGRTSYELLNSYWPTAKDRANATEAEIAYSNWYNHTHKIVLSKTMIQAVEKNTTVISGNIFNEVSKIKQEPGKNILLFGSPAVARAFMQLNLIDRYWIFINPVLFGKGIPLFTGLFTVNRLNLEAAKQFSNGEIALNYTPKK